MSDYCMSDLKQYMIEHDLSVTNVCTLLEVQKRMVYYWRTGSEHPIPPAQMQLLRFLVESPGWCDDLERGVYWIIADKIRAISGDIVIQNGERDRVA